MHNKEYTPMALEGASLARAGGCGATVTTTQRVAAALDSTIAVDLTASD